MTKHNRVVIETGSKKVFASAIDWPGWSRSGKTEEQALEILAGYVDRYRNVADLAGVDGLDASDFDIVEYQTGSGATDFGVPEHVAMVEHEPMTDVECERQLKLLRACWTYFDDVAARVSDELRKGPRGGGRNRQKIVFHTLEAERSYARTIGVKTPKGGMDSPQGLRDHRDAVCEAVRAVNAAGEETKWPVRYFLRRAAWHVLDHAWEMEDKDLTESS
ncbi:MAG TPA: hypothetical protein VNZ58_13590 [Thermomicrobiales bacterium]|nr:hypothetical protein [Thermomicrobiales bacterium]